MLRQLYCAVALSFAATSAQGGIIAEQTVEKEVVVRDADGTDGYQRVKADKVKPGEQVIYSLKYRNDGEDAASDVVLVMPVPPEVNFVEGSVSGDNTRVTFSADGGVTYVARGRLTIAENGNQRAARNNEITHIKWSREDALAPQGNGVVSYRGVLQ